jgi:Serine dehydrogenase proteinase
MATQGGPGEGSARGREGSAAREVSGLSDELVVAAGTEVVHPTQSPLFHAENSLRYDRQSLIRAYEGAYRCRLAVVYDVIMPYSLNVFEELVFDADPDQDLHLLLDTPGGDGEAAVRLVRSAQARCAELTVIIPDQAKSAGTILALGAHQILMGPTSDLGPIDPQLPVEGSANLVSAKDILAALSAAETAVQENPETYPLHSALLSDVTALMIQQARSALARSEDLMHEALKSNPDRNEDEVAHMCSVLKEPLIDVPKSHGAILGEEDAEKLGLPITFADPRSDQWQIIWRLWMKYWSNNHRIYEGSAVSKTIMPWNLVQ